MASLFGPSLENTVGENSSVFSLIRMRWLRQQGHAGSKTLHQQILQILTGGTG